LNYEKLIILYEDEEASHIFTDSFSRQFPDRKKIFMYNISTKMMVKCQLYENILDDKL